MQTVTTGAPSIVELALEYCTDEKCVELLESLRWPEGPRCPKCDCANAYDIADRKVYQCGDCDFQYSVTTGTVMHSTKLPLVKWILAAALISNARKGVSSCQLARDLKVQQKTAWYLAHRLRRAMRETEWLQKFHGICELDESYLGGRMRGAKAKAYKDKFPVFGIKQRGSNRVFMQMIPDTKGETLTALVKKMVDKDTHLMADQHGGYNQLHAEFTFDRINHSEEYVRGQIHTQGIESMWAILKRQFHGTHHQMTWQYLPLYLGEICFRYEHKTNPNLYRQILGNGLLTDRLVLSSLPAENAGGNLEKS